MFFYLMISLYALIIKTAAGHFSALLAFSFSSFISYLFPLMSEFFSSFFTSVFSHVFLTILPTLSHFHSWKQKHSYCTIIASTTVELNRLWNENQTEVLNYWFYTAHKKNNHPKVFYKKRLFLKSFVHSRSNSHFFM